MEFVIRFLTDHADGNKLITRTRLATGKYQSASLDAIVLFLQQCRLPLGPQGRPTTELRNLLLADIIEDIHLDFDFHPTRGDAAKNKGKQFNEAIGIRQSACSIVATAWRELESEVRENREPRPTRLERGFTPLNRLFRSGLPTWAKPLSESRLEGIWDEWAVKARASRP